MKELSIAKNPALSNCELGTIANLEAENNKILGGGIFERQLSYGTEAPIYILRKNEQTLKESCDLPYLIEQIDEKYITRFAEDPTMDCTGDCSEFLPNFVE